MGQTTRPGQRACPICDLPVNGHTRAEEIHCLAAGFASLTEQDGQAGQADWCPNCVVPESEHSDMERISCRIDVWGTDAVSEDERTLWERMRRTGDREPNVGLSI